MSKQNVLRGAVVGCRMGRGHAQAMASLQEYDLVAVCDLDEETARKAAAVAEDVKVYTDYTQMLEAEAPDVVAIATPNDSHERLTVQAAEAGVRGVCCEKPMAVNLGQARAMVAACERSGTALIVNHQRRMSAPLVKMRQLVEEGAIGDVYLVRGSCAGDILSDGTHTVDSLRHLLGDAEAEWVLGQIYRRPPDQTQQKGVGYHVSGGYRYGHVVETGGVAVVEFSGRIRAEMFFGKAQLPDRQYQDYEIFGTEGRLWRRGDRAEPAIMIQDESARWRGVNVAGDSRGAMAESYRQFARLIREGGEHPLSGHSALRGQEIVMAIYESARTHSRIDLPLQQEEFPLRLMVEAGQL